MFCVTLSHEDGRTERIEGPNNDWRRRNEVLSSTWIAFAATRTLKCTHAAAERS